MQITLIYPPTCDPTAPYISVPLLAGFLRAHNIQVMAIDSNIEAFDRLLTPVNLETLTDRVHQRLGRLKQKQKINHADELLFWRLSDAVALTEGVPQNITETLAVLRDRNRFFDPKDYEFALETVESALHLISAAYAPLNLDFKSYRTPFSLLNLAEIKRDALPENNPFFDYFEELVRKIKALKPDLVGISIAFPGQIQPAYSLAFSLRKHLPTVPLIAGGPAVTQLLLRLDRSHQQAALGPFDSAVLFEGESALLEMIHSLQKGRKPSGIIPGSRITDLGLLPAPDFDGLALDKYLSPALVLPYDTTRGCYWSKCAFCHYGLCEHGTAPYRERPAAQVITHLQALSQKYACRIFYFSQDTLAPKTALALSRKIKASGLACRWATDMRPEPALTLETCRELAEGGALSMALGVESGAERVLKLINKGLALEEIRTAIRNLAQAHIAVETMCFMDFPTETFREALATLGFIRSLKEHIALFICGTFGLAPGSRVARYPDQYGLAETWHAAQDEFKTALFYTEKKQSKSQAERLEIEESIEELSQGWWLHSYPWAGSLSTAHTLLWYDHYGPQIFRQIHGKDRDQSLPRPPSASDKKASKVWEKESRIWDILINQRRSVSRQEYMRLARRSKG
jgi:radical SAM superfamily enzyme YgiQ (UPF0313 family)